MIDDEIDDLSLALDFTSGQDKEFLTRDLAVAREDGGRYHKVGEPGLVFDGHKEHALCRAWTLPRYHHATNHDVASALDLGIECFGIGELGVLQERPNQG